ncbi:MAG: hypothetical protein B6I20_06115, partial [Bacteroidetes bacterium 4572_117]
MKIKLNFALIILIALLFVTCEKFEKIIVVKTGTSSALTATSATISGEIVDYGDGITQYGHCWSKTNQKPSPENCDDKTTLGSKSDNGEFSSQADNLEAATTYYVAAYATGAGNSTTGKVINFTTSPATTGSITLIKPDNTTDWQAGTIQNITWTDNIDENVNIELFKGGFKMAVSVSNKTNLKQKEDIIRSKPEKPTLTGKLKGTKSTAIVTDTESDGTHSWTLPTDLATGTDYTIKITSVNDAGITTESAQFTITAAPGVPTLTTTAASSITETTATSGGNVSDNGGAAVTVRGVCWATSQNPVATGDHTEDGTGTGTFTSSITGLTAGITYYVRAYATNSVGTDYGSEISFTTSAAGETVSDYDGNEYQTVVIGTQTWMAENLKVTHFADGTAINLVTVNTAWANLADNNADKAYCYYDNSDANRDTYGALYTWAAAMNGSNSSTANPSDVQGVCPTGWHLPSDAEWKELEMYLGMSQAQADAINWRGTNEGSKLAGNASLWNNGSLESNADFGISGFIALPGGMRESGNGLFDYFGENPYFWSTTENDGASAWLRYLNYDHTDVYRDKYNKSSGSSVRCVKGSGSTASLPTLTTTAASAITETTATSGGNITDDGGATVTARGVCWGTSTNPTTALGTKTNDGTGTGAFASSITGLIASTTYYVRAYATNSVETAYGNEVSFTTDAAPVIPTLTTTAASAITETTATSGGNITDDGGATVTARGVCWGTSTNPTTALSTKTSDGTGTGAFASSITGLTASTTYYVRAYATNSVETAYGNEESFMTSASTNGLIAYYPFNGNANDESGNNYHGTMNSITFSTGFDGQANSAVDFNGVGNIDFGDLAAVEGLSKASFAFWYKTPNNDSEHIISKYNSNIDGVNLFKIGVDPGLYAQSYVGGLALATGPTSFPSISSWSFIVVTFDGTETNATDIFKYYLNGEILQNIIADPSHIVTTLPNNTASFKFGSSIQSDGTENFSDGTLDNVRIYDRVITESEIQSLFAENGGLGYETGTVTDYDDNMYTTVKIGNQWWMQQNLKTTHYAYGTAIPLVTDNTAWANLGDNNTDKAYCYYDNSTANRDTYGALYTYAAATNGDSDGTTQGVCPTGWHLPSDAEWTELTDYLTNNGYGYGGSGNDIAKSLAATSGWGADDTAGNIGNDQSSNNSSGFSALPGGY